MERRMTGRQKLAMNVIDSSNTKEDTYLITELPMGDLNPAYISTNTSKVNIPYNHGSYSKHKRDKTKRKNVQRQKNVR